MNVQKTEFQAKRQAVQRTFTTAAGSSFPTFDPKTSRPRTHYKYLGVDIFTQNQAEGLDAMIRSENLSYFSRLSPLPLTLSERLVNSQLIPAVTYRLTVHPLPPQAIASLEDFIWRGLATGSITRLVSLKDRYASRARRGLAIKCLAHNVHTTTINFPLRALHGRAPPSVGSLVTNSLCDPNQRSSDELQNSVMDAAHALGLSFHSIGPWRPSGYEHLPVGCTITVKFKSGPSTGTVLCTSPSWANVQFADGVFFISSDAHSTHHHPCHSFLNYSRPPHQLLIPTFLRPQETIPRCPDPPHGATICSVTVHGHLLDLPGVCHRLYEEDSRIWGCWGALSGLLSPPIEGEKRIWAYSNICSGAGGHGSAIFLFHPDGWTKVLCLSSPHPSSLGAEHWVAAAAYRWLSRELPDCDVILLMDNEQVVTTYQSIQASTRSPNPFCPGGTWTAAVHELVHRNPLSLRAEWIKGHAGFLGNEIADHFSRSAAACLHFDLSLLPSPLQTFSARGLPLLHKVRCSNFRQLLPRHSHNNIAV